MKNQPHTVIVDPNLAWESARVDAFLHNVDCDPPSAMANHTPQWYCDLKSDLSLYRADKWRHNHTARYCKGLQGIRNLGWTIPLPFDLAETETVLSRKIIVPEMLHGTVWNDRDTNGEPIWDFAVIFWPWRARLSKGWRMLTMGYPLDWSRDWFSFAGFPPHNNAVNWEKNGINHMYQWEQKFDPDQYNYYNIETVHAFRRGSMIPKGSLIFSLVIIPPGN